ncbi:MAG: hypothetical protein R6W90_01245 [Ignavibacteriaceae bacterium]
MKNNLHKITIVSAAVFTFLFLAACSPGKENSSGKSEPGISLPPGSVSIAGEIISSEEHDNLFSVTVLIIKVNRYGGGAPLLNINDKLPVRINKSVLKNNNDGEVKINQGETYQLLIKYISSAGQTNNYWETLEIITN